ncbi:MAG: hypothetical protein A3F84_02255 [Candidatus Handelsmanbacteria bacterium RIFCSPLOWO2_12_FULL_64_10]|uniref:Helix-turn-helix domain-containing protein n=1 Tax=Handelsmanbacteria sp. (strain RIFCSPLOWO2_12_FULL_64_10) TaxID=1817868 RepID=A0A1F6CL78_HANXR|nr:MAG: hypothetical protein A3F84_02255 [Candidatus Handelsmanbacteria bacterium RIFCSPLOWO2_12_FULL_64_10]
MVDYFSFDEVMGELEVSEEELRRMVSEGELRAFRSENKMKFRKEDVEVLQTGKESEPTIMLPTDEEAAAGDDIALDLDIEDTAADLSADAGEAEPEMELDLEAEPEPEMDLEEDEPVQEEPAEEEEEVPTLEADTPDDSGLDDLTLAEDDATIEEADETLVEDEDMDTASTTAPLAFADEGGEEETEEETATGEVTEEGEFVDEEEAATAPRRGRRGAMAGAGATGAPKAGILWTVLLVLGFLPCIPIIMVFVDDFMLNSGVATQPGAVAGVYEFFGEKLWEDGEWKGKMIEGVPAGTVGDNADESDGLPRRTYKQYGTSSLSDAPKTTVGPEETGGGE